MIIWMFRRILRDLLNDLIRYFAEKVNISRMHRDNIDC